MALIDMREVPARLIYTHFAVLLEMTVTSRHFCPTATEYLNRLYTMVPCKFILPLEL